MKFNKLCESLINEKKKEWEETFTARGKKYKISVNWSDDSNQYVVNWVEVGKKPQTGSGEPYSKDFDKAVDFAKNTLKKRISKG